MYNCPTCGRPVSPNARWCPNCGETAYSEESGGGCATLFWALIIIGLLAILVH